jgi:hypothetical protein
MGVRFDIIQGVTLTFTLLCNDPVKQIFVDFICGKSDYRLLTLSIFGQGEHQNGTSYTG